jgi:hypothetical protein
MALAPRKKITTPILYCQVGHCSSCPSHNQCDTSHPMVWWRGGESLVASFPACWTELCLSTKQKLAKYRRRSMQTLPDCTLGRGGCSPLSPPRRSAYASEDIVLVTSFLFIGSSSPWCTGWCDCCSSCSHRQYRILRPLHLDAYKCPVVVDFVACATPIQFDQDYLLPNKE